MVTDIHLTPLLVRVFFSELYKDTGLYKDFLVVLVERIVYKMIMSGVNFNCSLHVDILNFGIPARILFVSHSPISFHNTFELFWAQSK